MKPGQNQCGVFYYVPSISVVGLSPELITFFLLPCFRLIICRISKIYSLVIYDFHNCTHARLVGTSKIRRSKGGGSWILFKHKRA